jgi:GcrA cell cycle regulator
LGVLRTTRAVRGAAERGAAPSVEAFGAREISRSPQCESRGAQLGAFLSATEPKPSPPRREWRQAAIALLRARWADGHSASQIAQAIERQTGQPCSRNAVIGKLHRLGLSGRTTPARSARLIRNRLANARVRLAPPSPRTQQRPHARLRGIPKVAPLAPQTNAEGQFVTVLNVRDGECRFIAGDPREDARYCARPTALRGRVHASFCPAHQRACYLPSNSVE